MMQPVVSNVSPWAAGTGAVAGAKGAPAIVAAGTGDATFSPGGIADAAAGSGATASSAGPSGT